VTTAGDRVEQGGPDVVGAEEPGRCTKGGVRPAGIARDVEGPSAGVCHRGRLDRLLIECRPWRTRLPAVVRREAEVIASGFGRDEPAEQIQSFGDEPLVAEREASRESGLREDRVRIGESLLRPRPRRVPCGLSEPPKRCLQELACPAPARMELDCPEYRERVRPRPATSKTGALLEAPPCAVALIGARG